MSSKSRKYKRIDALFAESPPAAPDSPGPDAVKPPLPALRSAAGADAPETRPAAPNALSVPLVVRGETVGAIQAAGEGPWTEREIRIADGAAERLARHLEKLSGVKGIEGT